MKILPIEEKFINLLTSIVWWFEVKFNKGATFVFFFICFMFPTIIGFLFSIIELLQPGEQSVSRYSINLLFLPLLSGISCSLLPIILTLFQWVNKRINVFKEAKKSPNPNNHNGWLWKARLGAFSILLTTVIVTTAHGKKDTFDLFTSLFVFLYMGLIINASTYTLCVETIPPQEKEKRKAKTTPSKTLMT